MLHELVERILNGLEVGGRMVREIVIRFFQRIGFGFRSMFSAVNLAGKGLKKLLKKLTTAFKKPTSREDYIETNGMFIAKNLLSLIIVGIVALVIFGITVVRPFLVSRYGVLRVWSENEKVESYNGRVILTHDEKKTMPKFEGRLVDGKAEGEGTEYDEAGNVIYKGMYAEGARSGKGTVYRDQKIVYEGEVEGENYTGKGKIYREDGSLLYEGVLSENVYEGDGTLYYPDGAAAYTGKWKAGLYDGQGTLYDDTEEHGLKYQGSFKEGVYDGQGTLTEKDKNGKTVTYRGGFSGGIYEGTGELLTDGKLLYKGDFSEGVYSGTGRLMDENGEERYRGEFSEGVFSGEGVYTAPSGIKISGIFEKGVINEDAVCSYGGDVFYKGSMNHMIPQGSGTLYAKTGSELYSGEITAWNVNASSLLGLSASDTRALFPQGVTESLGFEGFSLTEDRLGLSLYCNYATEEEEAAVKRAYLMPGAGDGTMDMIRWKTPADYENAQKELGRELKVKRGTGTCVLPDVYHSQEYIERKPKVSYRAYEQEDGSVLILWLRSTGTSDDSILLCEWRTADDAAEFTGKEQASSDNIPLSEAFEKNPNGEPQKPGKDNASLAAFLMEDMTLARTADSNVMGFLSQIEGEEEKRNFLSNLAAYQGASAGKQGADANIEIYQKLYEEAAQKVAVGKGEKEAADALDEKRKACETTSVEKDLALIDLEKKIMDTAGTDASEIDTQTVFLLVDPATLNPEELGAAVLSREQENVEKDIEAHTVAVGPGSTALEEGYEPPVVDPEAISKDLSYDLRTLEALYKSIGLAREDLKKTKEQAEQAEKAMSTGSGTAEALSLLKAQVNEKEAALIAVSTDFTKQMLLLDQKTGGLIAAKYQWFTEALPEPVIITEGNG